MVKTLLKDDLLTTQQVADELGCAASTVRKMIKDGCLKTILIGKRPRVHREHLEEYVRGEQA